MLFSTIRARNVDSMTSEENRRVPLSTGVSPRGSEVDPQLSACAQEGPPPGGLPETQPPERRRGATARAQADMASNTVRLAVGELLGGRYRIERELGEGGMGVVYLAADEQVPGERFAIKVLKEELHPEALTLLSEEVHKTRKLSHPNIVDVHSVNVEGQRLYVLMEYLEGKSLDALLDEEFGRGMPFSHAWPIIEDVGAALGNAHDHNVIHSDLKPANVFLTTSGRTKLLDFGIARVSRGPLLQARSGPRALTPAYASCEMLEGKEADRRDDIYSFACVIYEMLCGERPFGELTALEAREAGTQVPPLQGLSREQNAALAQALAFDREARTGTVEDLLAGLAAHAAPRARPVALLGAAILVVITAVGLTYLVLDKLWVLRHSVAVQSVAPEAQQEAAAPVAPTPLFNPPQHSIAVLPFVNMSGDKEQEYFSDGVSEELINSLSHVEALQVCARTSSFSFKGKNVDIGTIARKLNVAAILEGSIRRSGDTVRITAQLVNAINGFHIWSQSYDRGLRDILALQTDIASAVAQEMKVKLLGDEAARIEAGGTHNPAAYDTYLRGMQILLTGQDFAAARRALAVFDKAIALDPGFAAAHGQRARALRYMAFFSTQPAVVRESYAQARQAAERAVALAPDYADAHMVLGWHVLANGFLELGAAAREIDRAMALAPGSAAVLEGYAGFEGIIGHHDAALAAMRRAIRLDPQNSRYREHLLTNLYWARRFEDVLVAVQDVKTLHAQSYYAGIYSATSTLALGHPELASQICESPATPLDHDDRHLCLALADHALGKTAQARNELGELKALQGDLGAATYAAVYAQWGEPAVALRWLATAERVHRASLLQLKVDWMYDPIRSQPQFQALEERLNFPP
jgi:TolB-like protein/predicted Ser/Thr protein kinase